MAAHASPGMTQPKAALQVANAVRHERTRAKRNIAAGRVSVLDVLDVPALQNMKVVELLMAQRRWGRVRSRRLLTSTRISETTLVGSMTDRQRREVEAALTL